MPLADIAYDTGINASSHTISRILNKHGYHRRVAWRHPYLTKATKKHRHEWALEMKSFTVDNWHDICWSDESYIHIDDTTGRIYVTRRVGEELNDDCMGPRFKQSSIRVMVWGCVMWGWKGPLIILEYPGGKGGGMTAARYKEQVLEGAVEHFWKERKSVREKVKFQQDGAPSHSAKATQAWLNQHSIPCFPHPPNSPDLSPIEPVWHELKKRLRKRNHRPTTVDELQTAIQEEWANLEIKDIDKYIRTMPQRVAAVLIAHGGHTRY